MSSFIASAYLKMDFGDIHYLELPNVDKELLILFHPYSKDAKFALKLFSFLKDNFHLIAIDLPFHGDTEIQKSFLNENDFSAILDAILEKHKNKTYNILGHSFGARIACISCCSISTLPKKTLFYGPELGTTRYTQILLNNTAFKLLKYPASLLLSSGLATLTCQLLYRLRLIKKVALDFMQLHTNTQSKSSLLRLWKTLSLTNKHLIYLRKDYTKLGEAVVFFGKKDQTTPVEYYKKSPWSIPLKVVPGGHFSISQQTKNEIRSFLLLRTNNKSTP